MICRRATAQQGSVSAPLCKEKQEEPLHDLLTDTRAQHTVTQPKQHPCSSISIHQNTSTLANPSSKTPMSSQMRAGSHLVMSVKESGDIAVNVMLPSGGAVMVWGTMYTDLHVIGSGALTTVRKFLASRSDLTLVQ